MQVQVISKSHDRNSAQVVLIDTNRRGVTTSRTKHVRRIGNSKEFSYGRHTGVSFIQDGTVTLNI